MDWIDTADRPCFLEEMQEAVEWGDKVILYCSSGGIIGREAGGCRPSPSGRLSSAPFTMQCDE